MDFYCSNGEYMCWYSRSVRWDSLEKFFWHNNLIIVLGKGANLDGRYILKTRSDEKPADACVNGCIYYKGKELFDHQNNNDVIFPI